MTIPTFSEESPPPPPSNEHSDPTQSTIQVTAIPFGDNKCESGSSKVKKKRKNGSTKKVKKKCARRPKKQSKVKSIMDSGSTTITISRPCEKLIPHLESEERSTRPIDLIKSPKAKSDEGSKKEAAAAVRKSMRLRLQHQKKLGRDFCVPEQPSAFVENLIFNDEDFEDESKKIKFMNRLGMDYTPNRKMTDRRKEGKTSSQEIREMCNDKSSPILKSSEEVASGETTTLIRFEKIYSVGLHDDDDEEDWVSFPAHVYAARSNIDLSGHDGNQPQVVEESNQIHPD